MASELLSLNQIHIILYALDDDSKLSFLEKYLTQPNIPRDIAAHVLELMGSISIKLHRPNGDYFEKAGSHYEQIWAISHISKKLSFQFFPSIYLRRALNNYIRARSIYLEKDLRFSADRALKHIQDIRNQSRREFSLPAYTLSFFVFIGLFLSSLSFSTQFTGLSIAQIDDNGSFSLGIFLFIISFIGVIFVIKLLSFVYFRDYQ